MSIVKTEDLRIESIGDVITPADLHRELPMTDRAANLVHRTRSEIHELLRGADDRLLVIVGPCSIHDPDAARDYAGHVLQFVGRERLPQLVRLSGAEALRQPATRA